MELRDVIERIGSVDIASAGVSELAAALRQLSEVQGWASVTEGRITRRLAELEAIGASAPAADVVARSTHASRRAAQRAERRAETFGAVPALERHRSTGTVSDEHADALAAVAGKLDDEQRADLFALGDELARHAASSTPAQFARHLRRVTDMLASDAALDRSERQRGLATLGHGVNAETGMGWVRAELHPDDYQRFKRKIDAEVAALRKQPAHEGRRYDQVAAAAFVGLITSTRAAATPPAEVIVLVDIDTIIDGTHSDTVCEYGDGTPLPVATVRRHACTADIIPIVLGGNGQPLDVGRAKRHATPAQRRALRSMYRTCAIDGCEREFDACEIHHLLEWDERDGPTDLENLLPVCTYHHHRAHEGRWRLQLEASTRELSVFLPDATLHSRCLPDMVAERRTAA